MHAARLSAFGLTLLALVVTAAPAAAMDFTLPSITVASPGCGIFDASCAAAVGTTSTSFGTFTSTEQGDTTTETPTPDGRGICMSLSGTATLESSNGVDILALTSNAASDTLCYTQPLGTDGLTDPHAPGPWPLALTVSVDPHTSQGIYAGATGKGGITGSWTTTETCDPSTASLCGFSGGSLAVLTLTMVSIPNLTVVPPCTSDCGTGTGGGGPNPGATPELDSLLLFTTGLLSLGGYVAVRRRAGNRGYRKLAGTAERAPGDGPHTPDR